MSLVDDPNVIRTHEFVEVTVELTGLTYDNGYGDENAELTTDCTVKLVFDESGIEATDVDIDLKHATIWLIDQDGGNKGEIPYETEEFDEAIKAEARKLALDLLKQD